MRPLALCLVALAWAAGAPLAHAQVDLEGLIDSLTGLNGPGEVDAPAEEPTELPLESAAPPPLEASEAPEGDPRPEAEASRDDELEAPAAASDDAAMDNADRSSAPFDAPGELRAAPPRLEQGDNQIPDRVDLRAILAEQHAACVPAHVPPSLHRAPAAHRPVPVEYAPATWPHAADPLSRFRTPPCYHGVWDGFAAERAARCHAHHKCLHGTCECFTPTCASSAVPAPHHRGAIMAGR